MKTFDKSIATTRQTKRNDVGFVLIELLTAVAIIAILIGLLLPAIQRKREEAAAEEAAAKVRQAAGAANYYRDRTGEYPRSLAQLVQFVTSNPSGGISIDPRLASGKDNGYLYDILPGSGTCKIEAEPEFPGITGSRTVTAATMSGGEVLGADWVTAGSDEARQQMFNEIRLKAAETALKLVRLDSSAISEARSFVDALFSTINVSLAATGLDADGDGRITIDEIRNYDDPNMDNALKGPLREFMDYTDDACMWGSLSAASRANIGVSAGETELTRGDQAPLFSYDGLGVLTRIMVASDGLGASGPWYLCEKLEAAEAAEASGDLQARNIAVNSYKNLLKAEIGRSITRANANILAGRYGEGAFAGLLDVLTDQIPSVRQ